MKLLTRSISRILFVLACVAIAGSHASAQITPPAGLSVTQRQEASLKEYLVNRLRATTVDQRSYVDQIVKLVDQKKLTRRLVLALERYANRKSAHFPLPIFERALRVEAAKRSVAVPLIKEIVARNGASAAQAARNGRIR